MNRNEQEMYSNISSIAKSLEKIANALDNKVSNELVDATTKDIPGFEGVLNDLDNISLDYLNAEDKCKAEAEDEYEYEYDLRGIRVDSDHDIRNTAAYYEDAMLSCEDKDLKTKKDCILDYVTNEFGSHGARYTDIIKFAYYLGQPNAARYSNRDRGYYSCAISGKNAHLIRGGKDCLVKGINKEGNERYFAHSFVESFTDYWKFIS